MRRSINFSSLLVLALGVLNVVAQELDPSQLGTGKPSPPTASYNKGPDPGRVNHEVTVAKVSHEFDPHFINATIGDTITFSFFPREHSVVLTDFKSPCVPWSSWHPEEKDTWSGLITEETARKNPQTWTWKVDTNDPRFFYCSGPGSCVKWGMVFAVNPTPEQPWETFKKEAVEADYEMSPGQTPPAENGVNNGNSGDDPSDSSSSSGSKGISTGAIVGIVIGAIAAIAIIGLLFFLIGRSRRKSAAEKEATAAPLAQPPVDAGPAPVHYGDHPPPGYYGQVAHGQTGWDGKGLAPPHSPVPSQFNPHASMYGSPAPTNPHQSWAPSELGGESTSQPQRVEIYTPGIDDRVPLNNPPKSP